MACLLLLFVVSCSQKETFRVDGSVPDTTFNGSKVYLVALDGPISRNVDSTFIVNRTFDFEKRADSLCVEIIRAPLLARNALQELVVVNEKGTLNVVLSTNSHSEGTRLNNILQEWKELKQSYDSAQETLYSQKSREGVSKKFIDSIMKYSDSLGKNYESYVMQLMNENIHNGIGLLLFKVNYQNLAGEDKKRILKQTGKLYCRKDAQLRLMISNDKSSAK